MSTEELARFLSMRTCTSSLRGHLRLRQEKLEDKQETSLSVFRPLEVGHTLMTHSADYRT